MVIEEPCPLCDGTGREEHQYARADGEIVTESILCEVCDGKGRIILKEPELDP